MTRAYAVVGLRARLRRAAVMVEVLALVGLACALSAVSAALGAFQDEGDPLEKKARREQ